MTYAQEAQTIADDFEAFKSESQARLHTTQVSTAKTCQNTIAVHKYNREQRTAKIPWIFSRVE